MTITAESIREAWRRRGVELEGRLEEANVYAPVLVIPSGEPARVSERWKAQLEQAGFRPLDPAEAGDEIGVFPSILALPHVSGGAARRGCEIVVHYAMRGGLPENDQLPCRASLILHSQELLGHWSGRQLEEVAPVVSASDEQLVLRPAVGLGAAFDATRTALVTTGATIAADETVRARTYVEHLEARMREKGLSKKQTLAAVASLAIPRQITLLDRDGATLEIEAREPQKLVAVVRTSSGRLHSPR